MKKKLFSSLILFFSVAVPLLSVDKKSQKRKSESINFVTNVHVDSSDSQAYDSDDSVNSDNFDITVMKLAKEILNSFYHKSNVKIEVVLFDRALFINFQNNINSKELLISANNPKNFFLKATRDFCSESTNTFNGTSILNDSNFSKLYKIFSTSFLFPAINFKEENNEYTDVVVLNPGSKRELPYYG